MKRLVHGRRKRIFLILDNLRVHHSKAVKKWLKENADKIEVFHLPSYLPSCAITRKDRTTPGKERL